MASLIDEIKNFPDAVAAKVQGASEGIMKILEDIYAVFSAVGDFFSWLGLYASLLLIVTMIILYLLSIASPLEKRSNYLLTLATASLLAYVNSFPADAFGRYLLVMLLPALIPYLLLWSGRWMIKRLKRAKNTEHSKDEVVQQLLQSGADYHKEGDARKLKDELEAIIRGL